MVFLNANLCRSLFFALAQKGGHPRLLFCLSVLVISSSIFPWGKQQRMEVFLSKSQENSHSTRQEWNYSVQQLLYGLFHTDVINNLSYLKCCLLYGTEKVERPKHVPKLGKDACRAEESAGGLECGPLANPRVQPRPQDGFLSSKSLSCATNLQEAFCQLYLWPKRQTISEDKLDRSWVGP